MAPLAIVGIALAAVGGIVSSISKANALRSEAELRQIEGNQELLSQKRQLRQELGLSAVSAGASGLFGGSFADVFESQAIEDARFLGIIKQRTDFDVASLRQQAKSTLITGIFLAGTNTVISGARFSQSKDEAAAARRSASISSAGRDVQRRGQSSGNVFSTGRSATGFTGLRRGSTAFFI